jgi:micrococcal nuclease
MAWPRRRPTYGRVLPTHRWQGRSRLARFWGGLKWWLGAALLAGLCWYFLTDTRIGPTELPQGPSEQVTGKFVRCGQHGSANCVPDGDTIMLGPRRIRIMGIDAPELHPARCPAEAAKGEAAAGQLLALVNQGPFTLAGPTPTVYDEYGRELKHLLRARPDGSVQSIADDLVASGTVRPYLRGPRDPWC